MDRFTLRVNTHLGEAVELTPQSLTLSKSLASPAQSLRASMPLSRWLPEILSLTLLRNGSPILELRPDQQTASYGEDGMRLTITARTKGAILLDNEALPTTYYNVTTQSLFNQLIGPHGFALLHLPKPALASFTVRKGLTTWEVFSAFVRRVHGVEPYIDGDGVYAMAPVLGDPVTLGGREKPIQTLERVIDHYEPLSRVCIRNEEGIYASWVGNIDATDRGINRVRYLIPAGEFATAPAWGASQRITRSMRRMTAVRVSMPGYFGLAPGRGVQVEHPRLNEPNLLVDESEFTLDQRGARTTLTLRNALYYS